MRLGFMFVTLIPLQNITNLGIDGNDYQEWVDSCIDPEIINLNLISLIDDEPYEYLLYSESVPRRNDGRIRDFVYKKYRHIESGGWWCAGIDPLNDYKQMMWGCFKPRSPRRDPEKPQKRIKYEHPYRVSTRAFFLAVPDHVWEMVSDRYQVPIEDSDRELGFWHWVWLHNIPVILCEGCKKAGALLSLGYAAIGLPGVNGGYRNPKDALGNPMGDIHLIPNLKHFADGRDFTICFDKDANIATVQRVRKAIGQTARLLALHGCNVRVSQWEHPEKGIDDLIAARGQDTAVEVIEKSRTFEQWQVAEYSRLSYQPALALSQRYLEEILVPEIQKLIVLHAPKGSGKTESLAPIVAQAIQDGQPVILISHRVQLAQAIADRVGIPYITEVRHSEFGSLLGFALCIDSLHPFGQARFNAENWKNPLVIIDESEQVFWHTLTATTEVKKQRLEVFKQMSQLLKNAFAPGRGKVIIADADMSDLSIELVLGLGCAKNIYPWIVQNIWRGQPCNIFHYEDTTPEGWLGALDQHLKDGGKPFIAVDGQKARSQWGTKVIEGWINKNFPHLKVLRIDSESIADPEHPAFGCISELNSILLKYDVVLASPSIGTGVSIDILGHFSSVWGCFQGVASENATRQALARVREPIDRHIWVAKMGLGLIGNGSINLKSLLSSEHQKFKANLHLLQEAGMSFDTDIDINRTALNVWGKMACRINAGMIAYREAVIDGLRAEGHTILEPGTEPPDGSKKREIKTIKTKVYGEECADMAAVDISEMTPTKYEALQQQRAKTKTERYQQRKYGMEQKYGVEVTANLITKDDEGYYPQLRLHYFLTVGKQFLNNRDRKAGEKILETNSAWLPDFNKGQLGLTVAALEKLGLLEFIAAGELRGTDEPLVKMAEAALSVKWQMKTVLKIGLNDKDGPIVILRQLLKKIGLRLEYLSRDGSGDRARVYRVVGQDDGRNEIFQNWLASERPLTVSKKIEGQVDQQLTEQGRAA